MSTVDKGQDVAVQEGPLGSWVSRLGYTPLFFAEIGLSGATTSRPVLDMLLKAVRRREVAAVAVLRLDRLGRSLAHLLQLLGEFDASGVRLLVHDQALDTSTPSGRLFFAMVGAFAEYERNLIAERVKDGLAHAQTHGTKSGRPIGRPRTGITSKTILDAASRHPTVAAQSRFLRVPRPTLYRVMRAAGYVWDPHRRTWALMSESPPPADAEADAAVAPSVDRDAA